MIEQINQIFQPLKMEILSLPNPQLRQGQMIFQKPDQGFCLVRFPVTFIVERSIISIKRTIENHFIQKTINVLKEEG